MEEMKCGSISDITIPDSRRDTDRKKQLSGKTCFFTLRVEDFPIIQIFFKHGRVAGKAEPHLPALFQGETQTDNNNEDMKVSHIPVIFTRIFLSYLSEKR